MFRHVKISSDLPTGLLKRKLSHLGQTANMKIENPLWPVTDLFKWRAIMSSLLVEEGTTRKSKEPTVITTATGKAEATEEAKVHVNDLYVVTLMLLEDSPALGFASIAISGVIMRRNGILL